MTSCSRWFASWHSLLPVLAARLLGRPSVVVVGGYDTANVPAAGYGSQRGGVRKLVSRTVLRTATRLLATSESARREAVAGAGADPGRVSVVYNAVEAVAPGPPTCANVWY